MSDCLLLSKEQADLLDELKAQREQEMAEAQRDFPRRW